MGAILRLHTFLTADIPGTILIIIIISWLSVVVRKRNDKTILCSLDYINAVNTDVCMQHIIITVYECGMNSICRSEHFLDNGRYTCICGHAYGML